MPIVTIKSVFSINYRVVESKTPDYSVGDLVIGHFGWVTYTICVVPKGKPDYLQSYIKLDPNMPLPPSTTLGILGMPG